MQVSPCKGISCAPSEQTPQSALGSARHIIWQQKLQKMLRSIEGRLPGSNSYKASSADLIRAAPAVWQCRLKGESHILVGLPSFKLSESQC